MTTHAEQDLANAHIKIIQQFEAIGAASPEDAQQDARNEHADLFCRACLDHEVDEVRRVRMQYGQGINASTSVLKAIATTRMQALHMPIANLLAHLKDCSYAAIDIKRICRRVRRRMQPHKPQRHHNRYDYGSLHERTLYPQYAAGDVQLAANGASPAVAYSDQQTALYKLARQKYDSRTRAAARRATRGWQTARNGLEIPVSDSDTSSSDRRAGSPDHPMRKASQSPVAGSITVEQPESIVDDNSSMPSDFPHSDILKSIAAHSAHLYEKRGLLSIFRYPEDTDGRKLPSMLQALDGSALICLGVLAECLVDAELNVPDAGPHLQPASGYFTRQIVDTAMKVPKKDEHIVGLAETILEHLPRGCEIGYKQLMTWPDHIRIEPGEHRRAAQREASCESRHDGIKAPKQRLR